MFALRSRGARRYIRTLVHMHLRVCVEVRSQTLCRPPSFLRQSLTGTWNMITGLVWLAREPRGSCCPQCPDV